MEGFEENYERGSRIPHTFRATKPFFLLACKRSSDALSPPPSSKCPRRVPLSEIRNGCSTPPVTPTPRSCHRDSIVSPSSSVIDEDFDEAFLRDVDALCEERSTAKKERPSEENGKDSWRRVVGSGEELDLDLQGSLNRDAGDWPVQQQKYWDYLKSLNHAQREAACSDISVPLMIVAGPGSGKTSTMVGRVLTLLEEGIGPSNILAMTFTIAAASEMRDRIRAVAGKEVATDLEISTFHSFCLQLCRRHAEKCVAPFLIVEINAFILTYKHLSSRNNYSLYAFAFINTCLCMVCIFASYVVDSNITYVSIGTGMLNIANYRGYYVINLLGRTPEFLIYGPGQQRRAVIEALRIMENDQNSAQETTVQKFEDLPSTDIAKSLKENLLSHEPCCVELLFHTCHHLLKRYHTTLQISYAFLASFSEADCKEHFQSTCQCIYIVQCIPTYMFYWQAKASGRAAEECDKIGDETGAMILRHYDEILTSCNALDYHDFISSSVKLLTDFPEVYNECLNTWKAIVIDEFQDTSSMQYRLLRILASHNRVTIVGDEDQSIFSFNGADVCGFDSFRNDFPTHREIRLNKNYRSTRYIVEAASAVILNNNKCCHIKQVETDNSTGSKIIVMECHNEEAQCAFVADKILEITSDGQNADCSFGNVAILYRRQVSGRAFQMCFRNRKIPFNSHGVAFYRKKAMYLWQPRGLGYSTSYFTRTLTGFSCKLFNFVVSTKTSVCSLHVATFDNLLCISQVIKAIMAILRTTFPDCDDGPFRQAFKALLPGDKEEKKMVVDYVERISSARKCSFQTAANDIFHAKVSGTFKRFVLTQGRKVLSALDMLSKLVRRVSDDNYMAQYNFNLEVLFSVDFVRNRQFQWSSLLQQICYLRFSISSMLQIISMFLLTIFLSLRLQKYLLEKRAVVDVEGGKLLNEDNDLRSVVQYLMDDVSDFLSMHFTNEDVQNLNKEEGCGSILKSFIDFITMRETENFRSRRQENKNSVTVTTIHQSKGLEWDVVFIVKVCYHMSNFDTITIFIYLKGFSFMLCQFIPIYFANDNEIPLLHEYNGIVHGGNTLEEERRLLYVAMTRARKKLYVVYTIMDSNWQLLQPSRFLKEIPGHLLEIQGEAISKDLTISSRNSSNSLGYEISHETIHENGRTPDDISKSVEGFSEICLGNQFLKRFNLEERSIVSSLFHQWAKRPAFHHPNRLLDKIGFVVDERLRNKTYKHKV
ncbi:unnamed protein product [Musa textilis]